MWTVFGTDMQMAEGDFGIKLPIQINGTTITDLDTIRFSLQRKQNVVLSKDFGNIQDNIVDLELTKAESDLLSIGNYTYSLDWYQNGLFMCNIIPQGKFKVISKL